MKSLMNRLVSITAVALVSLITVGASTPSLADTGLVRAVVTKAGLSSALAVGAVR